jgi:hypothetical protein
MFLETTLPLCVYEKLCIKPRINRTVVFANSFLQLGAGLRRTASKDSNKKEEN